MSKNPDADASGFCADAQREHASASGGDAHLWLRALTERISGSAAKELESDMQFV